jgi:hypothetical protein
VRARTELAVFASFFALLGLAALAIGVHDFSISSASFGITVTSLVLMAFGIVLLFAAQHLGLLAFHCARDATTRPECKARVLVACTLTGVLGVYIFLSGIGGTGAQRPVVLAVSLLLIAVSVAGILLLFGRAGFRIPRLQAALLLTIVGTAIGLSEFLYTNDYAPSHLGRAVSLSAALQLAGTKNGYDLVRVRLAYEDVGRDVTVVGSTYSLTGSRVVGCRRAPTPRKLQQFFERFNLDPERSRFMTDTWEVQPATLLAAGKFVGDGKQLDADVPASRELQLFVPHGRYSLLRLRAQLFAISATVPVSRSSLPVYVSIPGDHDEYGFWRIDDFSWLHALTYGRRRWVALRYELAAEPGASNVSPDLRVTARFLKPTWGEASPTSARLQAAFAAPEPTDSSEPFADAELALAPVLPATRADNCPVSR